MGSSIFSDGPSGLFKDSSWYFGRIINSYGYSTSMEILFNLFIELKFDFMVPPKIYGDLLGFPAALLDSFDDVLDGLCTDITII